MYRALLPCQHISKKFQYFIQTIVHYKIISQKSRV